MQEGLEMRTVDYVVYQRQKAHGLAPVPRIGCLNEEMPELIDTLADAYGYINGIPMEEFAEIPERAQDRICYATERIAEALEMLKVRINDYEIKG